VVVDVQSSVRHHQRPAQIGRCSRPALAHVQPHGPARHHHLQHLEDIGLQHDHLLAGLQAIPAQFYEAATIDGAGPASRFWRVTVPLLAPTTAFILIYNSILAFQVFDQVFVLTGGGPANSTNVVVLDLYRQAFERYNFGYAAAEAMVLFLCILGITILQYVYSKRYEVAY
jgi:multiple sugar transport system permease protein